MNAQAKDRQLADRIRQTATPGTYLAGLASWHLEPHARTLRRAQLTLHRWAELECGTEAGHIEEAVGPDGKGYYLFRPAGRVINGKWIQLNGYVIPDRERGALARIEKVCKAAGLHYYHQTDPRGCALYVAAEPLNSQNYSSKGIACL